MTLDEQLLNAVSEAMGDKYLLQGDTEAPELRCGHRAPEDAEPLAQWLNSTFARTDDLMVELNQPAYRFMSRADVMEGLGISYDDVLLMAQIAARLHLIAGNIDARQATGFKVVRNG